MFLILDNRSFPDDFEELIPLMKSEAVRINKKIESNKAMYSWKYQECTTEECKQFLIKKFLKQLFKLGL